MKWLIIGERDRCGFRKLRNSGDLHLVLQHNAFENLTFSVEKGIVPTINIFSVYRNPIQTFVKRH